jgi:hypothetical protein
MVGRRRLLLGALAGLLSKGCAQIYECEGAKVAVPVNGNVMPTTASYFNQGGIMSRSPVIQYDSELADLLNETFYAEHGFGINRHICVQYVDELSNGDLGQYNTESSSEFGWLREKEIEKLQILMANTTEPFRHFECFSHELGHWFGPVDEKIASLEAYRLSTMANVHFSQFAKDTNYLLFAIGHGQVFDRLDWNDLGSWDVHNYGTIAALLALNETNGQFAEAHRGLVEYPGEFAGKARDFVDYYASRRNLVWGKVVQPSPIIETDAGLEERVFAMFNLWNIVAYQVLTYNIEANPNLDDATRAELLAGMKSAARFKLTSNPGNHSGALPSINPPQANFYNGAVFPQNGMKVPVGYNNNIPQGL